LSARTARRHGAGRVLRQHRAGFLMMWRPLFVRLIAAIVALAALSAGARAAEADKGMLANLLSRALSSPTTSVSIGAVEGALSSDASISDIVLSDRDGPWLKIDKVRLVWNRLALFSRRLEVDQLTLGHVQFLRRPLPSGTPPAESGGSILPELPLKVVVKQFGLQELSLGEPVISVAAGPDVWARGDVIVAREGAGRKLSLNLNSRLEGMAPPIIRPVFAGETTLKGDLIFGDDSTIATPGLHLVSANARLDIVGGRSADNTLGIKIHAGAIPGSEIGKLDLDASVAGPTLSPTIEGGFNAGAIHVEQGSLDQVSATFRAVPNGPLTEEATRIAFDGQAAMSGLALADPALAHVVGGEAKLVLR